MATPNKDLYRRKVLSLESIHLRRPGAIVSAAARVTGPVDAARFHSAVQKLLHLHPVLNSRVVRDEDDILWLEELPGAHWSNVAARTNPGAYRVHLLAERNRPFDVWNEPPARFVLVQGEEESEILLVCHQLVSDGPGLVILTDQLLTLLSKPMEALPQEEELLAGKAVLARRGPNGKPKYRSGLAQRMQVAKWRKNRFILLPEDGQRAEASSPGCEAVCYEESLSPGESQRLLDLCKQNQTPVTAVLSAAFLFCRQQIDPAGDNGRHQVSVDLRRQLGKQAKGQAGCFIGALNMEFRYDEGKSFWHNAKAFGRLLELHKARGDAIYEAACQSSYPPDFWEAEAFAEQVQQNPKLYQSHPHYRKLQPGSNHVAARAAAQALRDRPGFIVHNLGKIRLQDYGPLQVDAFSVLPPHNPDAATLTFSTMNGRLVYALCGEKYEGDRHCNLRWISLRQGYRAFLTGGLFEIV